MFRDQIRVMPKAVVDAFDLNHNGIMQQTITQS
jgi:hypothetical protein